MFPSAKQVIIDSGYCSPVSFADCENSGITKKRFIAAAAPVEHGSRDFFLLCSIGGALSCGLTHTLIVPLDLVKCRLQVDPGKYKNLINGFKVSLAEDGKMGMVKGWAPTLIGYSLQGTCKFGLYEYFKIGYAKLLTKEQVYNWRTGIYLLASATAEFFADAMLVAFESIKVKIQTTPGYANTMREAAPKMYAEEGPSAFYKSLVPLWLRQIPYTMMKFASFEKAIEILYKHVVGKPRKECSKGEQLVVTFAAGYIAGVFCAIVSHPADTLVSKLNQEKGKSIAEVAKQMGLAGMWKGLGPRILMIGTLTALQWFIYDTFKVMLEIPIPPPIEMPKKD